jgi:uncharacterized protein YndB with AHSA1/START domain
MTVKNEEVTESSAGELVVTRTFNAPRELVWKAYTEAEHLMRWWGPKGAVMRVARLDLHPGGHFHYCYQMPDGNEMWGIFVYQEILAPESLIFTSAFSDAEGNIVRAPFSTEWPLEILNTVTFTEHEGQTNITMRGTPLNATDAEHQMFAGASASVQQGIKGTLDQLEEYLATAPNETADPGDLIIERIFDAPRTLVWKAWTDPEQVMRWWGPESFTSPVCKIDLSVGGKYLFCMQSPEGQKYWSTGVYQEISPPEKLVYTDSFADEQGNAVPASYYGMGDDFPFEMLVTVIFEELDGKTRMILRQTGHPPGEMTEMATAGWNGSFDKLAESLR